MTSWNAEKFFNNLSIILFLIFLYGVMAGVLIGKDLLFSIPLSLLGAAFFIYMIRRLGFSTFNRLKGMIGEAKVGIYLDFLGRQKVRWIPSAVFGKNGDVDCIAIGKTGVWTIDSKYYDGVIGYKNGQLTIRKNWPPDSEARQFSKDFLTQAIAEAGAVKKHLIRRGYPSVPVRPVIVFSAPYSKVRFLLEPKRGVYVLGLLGLEKLFEFEHFEEVLTDRQIEILYSLFSEEMISSKQKPA